MKKITKREFELFVTFRNWFALWEELRAPKCKKRVAQNAAAVWAEIKRAGLAIDYFLWRMERT